MTMQPLLGRAITLPEVFALGTTPAFISTAATINDTTEKYAVVFQCPRAGTLDTVQIGFRTVSINAASVVRVSFQTLDVTIGDPDGTQDQFRDLATDPVTNTWHSTIGLITSDGTDTGTKRTVTDGELLCVVVEYQTFTAADSIVCSAVTGAAPGNNAGNFPYSTLFTAAWVKSAVIPSLVLKYDDGVYLVPDGCFPAQALNAVAFASNTNPDERGLLFQVPWPCRFCGVLVHIDLDGDTDFVLYDAANNVLSTVSRDNGCRLVTQAQDVRQAMTAVNLVANTDYRLVVKPTTTTTVTIYDVDAPSTAVIANFLTSKWQYTSRVDAGAWTDVNTKVPFIYPMFNGFDDGAGGGGGPLIGGRLVQS